MNTNQVMSIARAMLQIVGTALVTYSATTGITEEMWATITGGVLMIVPVAWGLFAHTTDNIIEAAAKLPQVDKVSVKSSGMAERLSAKVTYGGG